MKIGAVQTRPVTGNMEENIENHRKLIDLAVSSGADVIIFPELSLTGYEPTLAKQLATTPDDRRLDVFQRISDSRQITIGVGVPTAHATGIRISMVLFQPHQPRHVYSKQYLHADEVPFFGSGPRTDGLLGDKPSMALAICYELSVPEHAENAFKNGAGIYVASVAKFVSGMDKALVRLSEIARTYSMTVIMANAVGPADGGECAGKTSIWNSEGGLLGQLDGTSEGILLINTDTQAITEKRMYQSTNHP